MSELAPLSLKPIWLLGCGAGFGLLLLLLLWGVAALIHRPAGAAIGDMFRETVTWPVLLVAGLLAFFALGSTVLDAFGYRIFEQKQQALKSLVRIGHTGSGSLTLEVPPKTLAMPIALQIPAGELGSIQFESTRDMVVAINEPDRPELKDDQRIHLRANDVHVWNRGRDPVGPLAGAVGNLYVANDGSSPATLVLRWSTEAIVPQAAIIRITAAGLFAYVGLLLLLQWWFPKVSAVALATAREAMAQPLFYLVLSACAVLLLLLLVMPFFTFGEDVKEYKTSGLELIMIASNILAVWTASVSVADEIEGRTALTVLSKPIGRIQFVLGKYLGIVIPVAVVFIVLGTMFLMCTSYKVVYDARETGESTIVWQDCYTDMAQMVPGLVLAFMETTVLAAISVAISTRLPLLPNLIICTAIYMVGNLVPLLVQSTLDRFELVKFMGQLLATILPNLEHYSMYGAVASGVDIPLGYLALTGVCTMIYIAIALLLALAMFEDRDLA